MSLRLSRRLSDEVDFFCFLCGAFLIVLHTYWFFTKPTIIHPEVYVTFPPMIYNGNGSLIHDAIRKTFNAEIIENGHYRPRALGFFVHWIDVNATVFLSKYLSYKKLRFLCTFAASLCVAFFAYKTLLKSKLSEYKGVCLLASASFIFIPQFQIALYTTLRSGKLLSASVFMFLLYFFISKNKDLTLSLNNLLKIILYAFVIFALLTVDEQAIAMCLFILSVSILCSLIKKNIDEKTVTLSLALIFYCIWHTLIGKIVFQAFTPTNLLAHPHKISDVSSIKKETIFLAISLMKENIELIFSYNYIAIFSILALFSLYLGKARKKQEERDIFILILLTPIFIISLISACIASHGAIALYYDLRTGTYMLPAAITLYFILLFSISESNIFTKTKRTFICIILSIFISCSGLSKIDTYRNWLVAEHGVLMVLSEESVIHIAAKMDYMKIFLEKIDKYQLNGYSFTFSKSYIAKNFEEILPKER